MSTGPSVEVTAKDEPALRSAAGLIAPGTRVHITYLGTEDLAMRVAVARAAVESGFLPVAHLAARRLRSAAELDETLAALAEVGAGAVERVFAVGGDPDAPLGPFADALALLESGFLQAHGVREVGIAGYPEGHPLVASELLWEALERKAAAIAATGLDGFVVTQFGFDVDAVLDWLARLRERGITLPARIGVPGPAGVRLLLGYARRLGVASSAGIVRKYGLSLTRLVGTAGPDRFVSELAARLDPAVHGEAHLHLYAFGGIHATAEWMSAHLA